MFLNMGVFSACSKLVLVLAVAGGVGFMFVPDLLTYAAHHRRQRRRPAAAAGTPPAVPPSSSPPPRYIAVV